MALDPTGSKVCLDVIIDVSSGGIRLSGHQQHLLSAYRGCQEKESPRETYSPALHGAGRRRFLRAVFPPLRFLSRSNHIALFSYHSFPSCIHRGRERTAAGEHHLQPLCQHCHKHAADSFIGEGVAGGPVSLTSMWHALCGTCPGREREPAPRYPVELWVRGIGWRESLT